MSYPPRRAAAWIAVTVAFLALAGSLDAAAADGKSEPALAPPDQATEQAITAAIAQLSSKHRQVIRCRDRGLPPGWESLYAGVHIQVVDEGAPLDCWLMPADWVGMMPMSQPKGPGMTIHRAPTLIILHNFDNSGDALARELDPPPQAKPSNLSIEEIIHQERWKPTPDHCTPEEERRGTAAARATFERFASDDFHDFMALRAFGRCGVHAMPFFRELCAPGHSCMVRAGAIEAVLEHAEAADVKMFATLLNHEDPDRDHYMVQTAAAKALLRLADPAAIPDLLTALQHLRGGGEALRDVVNTLAELHCRSASSAIMAALRDETNPFAQGSMASALAILDAQEAVPQIRSLCHGREISGHEIGRLCMNGDQDHDPLVALARLTLPWGPEVNHARLVLLPYRTFTTLGRDCKVTLLIACVDYEISELSYMFGTVIIDGAEHRLPPPGAISGMFTMFPGRIAHHDIELGTYITAPGTYQVSYRAGAVTNTLTLTVVGDDAVKH